MRTSRMVARHHVMRLLVMIFAPRGQARVEAEHLAGAIRKKQQMP